MKGLLKRFHLNGNTIGFHPQTQKLESPYQTPSNTLAVKGLKVICLTRKYAHPGQTGRTFFEPWMGLIPHLGDQILKVTRS